MATAPWRASAQAVAPATTCPSRALRIVVPYSAGGASHDFRACWQAWDLALRAEGLPFSAVEVAPDMFAPGARVVLDLWGHVPD
jgi:hypothetical protein